MFSKVRGVITQQHVLQGTWLDKFTCWSADKVSRGQSCSYGGHRNDVLLGLSSRPRQFGSTLPLVGRRKHGPWSARISDACSSVWRQIVSGMRKFCPLTNCRRQQELLPHRSVKHREEKLLCRRLPKSLPSVSVAIAHVNNLHALLARDGFRLAKWVSNSQKNQFSVGA